MEGPAVVLRQPLPDGPVLVGGAVVQDDLDILPSGHRRFDLLGEFLVPVAPGMASDDHSVQDVQGGEQGRDPMPLAVARHRGGSSRLHRQALLRPAECLDLCLLVDRQHDRMFRRVHVQPVTSRTFSSKSGPVETSECRHRCGAIRWGTKMRCGCQ